MPTFRASLLAWLLIGFMPVLLVYDFDWRYLCNFSKPIQIAFKVSTAKKARLVQYRDK